MKHLSLKRILLVFSVMLVFGVFCLSWMTLNSFSQITSTIVEEKQSIQASEAILKLRYHVVQIQQFMTDASLTGDEDSVKEADENKHKVLEILKQLSQSHPSGAELYRKAEVQVDELFVSGQEMMAAYVERGKSAGDEMMKRPETGFDARAENLHASTESLLEEINKHREQESELLLKSASDAKSLSAIISLIITALVVAVVVLLFKKINPLDGVILTLDQVIEKVVGTSAHLGQLAGALNASSQAQSSATQQTASAIEEISSMIRKTNESVEGLSQRAQTGVETLGSAQSDVYQMVVSMEEIQKSSTEIDAEFQNTTQNLKSIIEQINEIGTKTKVINEIVFQTRLLSFNASVEASRAGEAGKGFAVVAEEISKLAQMSGGAAQEITDLLERSTTTVDDLVRRSTESIRLKIQKNNAGVLTGTKTAGACNASLSQVTDRVVEISGLADEIKQAVDEQNLGVNEVGAATRTMSDSNNANLKSVADLQALVDGMTIQAQSLNQVSRQLVSITQGKGEAGA